MAGQLGRSYGNIDLSAESNAILGDVHHHHYAKDPAQKDNYDILYHSLSFEGMHSRLRNVEMALPQTCEWLRSHRDFLLWKDHTQASEHRGLLWIKGKPGSGKSTIVKDTLEWARREWPEQLIVSYFFNARAPSELEKSCLGLYRSLTHQLLSLEIGLRSQFVEEFWTKRDNNMVEPWTKIELQNFLLKVLAAGCLPHLNIFIDALDEGDYNDVWSMIAFFEKAADCSMSTDSLFRLCLSSRHYPQISVETGIIIVLENQLGHSHDIRLSIEKLLPGRSSVMDNIRDSLLRKADGIFLWVVLTITLLRPLHSRGRLKEMRRQLEILPSGLHDLFFAIMTKDAEDLDNCVTLLQWMLVRKRVLSPHELYHAIRLHDVSPDLEQDEKIEQNESDEDVLMITNYIVDCSRGFVEVPEGTDQGVHFIHETVRQFLISIDKVEGKPRGFRRMPLDFASETCNLVVAEACLRYLLPLCRGPPPTKSIFQEHPLARYAAKYWWQHLHAANISHSHKVIELAEELLTGSASSLLRWVQLYDIDMDEEGPHFWRNAKNLPRPIYYVASIGLPVLFTAKYLSASDINALGGRFGTALGAASAQGHIAMAQLLLNEGADVRTTGDIALQLASFHGHKSMVQLLLDRGANINARGEPCYGTALAEASAQGHKGVVRLLLEYGADVNAGEVPCHHPYLASRLRHGQDIVQLPWEDTALISDLASSEIDHQYTVPVAAANPALLASTAAKLAGLIIST